MALFTKNPLASDLDHILKHTATYFEDLREQKVFITGGTGFFGSWLLESFIWANRNLKLGAKALVLTRNVELFQAKSPHLASSGEVEFLNGDIRSFKFPQGWFAYVIHAATEASTLLNERNPALMLNTVVQGMKRVLEFAKRAGSTHLLFTSSGAVYGPQPSSIAHMPEDYGGGPDPLKTTSAYGEGKRLAELLSAIAAKEQGTEVKIARCYAFVGPYLAIDSHFAIGNFIRDGLNGGPIKIHGDGTPYRSYLYASDLMIWLWTLLFRGESLHAYNVGSEQSHSISEIAKAVSAEFKPQPKIEIAQKPDPQSPVSHYVPSTYRARKELGLIERVPLPEAIAKTIAWHQGQRTSNINVSPRLPQHN